MAKVNRASVLTVKISGLDPQVYVVSNKTALNNLLFCLAIRHWDTRMGKKQIPIATPRQAIVDTFFGFGTGNSFNISSCQLMTDDNVVQMVRNTERELERRSFSYKRRNEFEAEYFKENV